MGPNLWCGLALKLRA